MIVRQRTGFILLVAAAVVALCVALFFRGERGIGQARVPWAHPLIDRDLEAIAIDTLRVLVLNDPLTWEERPNAVTGAEYELMERFAEQAGLVLKAIPVDDRDSMFLALQRGDGDVIAAQYTPRHDERGWFAVSRPYYTVRPMIARPRTDPWAKKAAQENDTVYVSAWSPFAEAFVGRKRSPQMVRLPGTPEEQLMELVIGSIPAIVVTDATAAYEGKRFPALEFVPIEGTDRPLCFAMRTNAPELRGKLDEWLTAKKEVTFRTALFDSYLDRMTKPGALRKRTMPADADSISPYDAAFKKYGGGFGWKWQLLTAMAWKESRFDSSAVSNMGAQGIMQFMPNTASHFGLDTALSVADHIDAAKRYITRLDTLWMRAVPDREQRLRFVLASYNAGVGHIIDAQRLADRLGLDPERWEHNVERAVLLLAKPRYYMRPEMKNGFCRGSQVFHYVRDIVALYHQLTGLPQAPPVVEAPESAPEPSPAVVEESAED
jgi:membrane-bound lytic murein transglycosylase F